MQIAPGPGRHRNVISKAGRRLGEFISFRDQLGVVLRRRCGAGGRTAGLALLPPKLSRSGFD